MATYLPGEPIVPCMTCGEPINRRGASGVGHQRYCKPPKDCRLVAHRAAATEKRRAKGAKAQRTDGICAKCGVHPRPARPDGRLRGWCRPCESKQKGEYLKTEAGLATLRRYYHRKTGSTTYGYTPGEPLVGCGWCGTMLYRRGGHGAGRRKWCSDECKRLGQNHERSLREAAARR